MNKQEYNAISHKGYKSARGKKNMWRAASIPNIIVEKWKKDENLDIFKEPLRPNFVGEPTPIFYFEVWGDYWGYFTYIKEDSLYGEQGLANAREMGPYLGRVNLFAVVPTLILAAGWLLGALRLFNFKKPFPMEYAGMILFLFIATVSMIGFTVFIINYYALSDTTLKANVAPAFPSC